ncbi:hypothetical protein QCE63_21060 [Caballeronia sp. LZ065]|uniref:hypothetical protein n=1 Tax=Caballeronia sp. LZ065 TaxID=3038571 RepID=UPI0028648FF6|nr:hypothetical protein [Caballeronia sp. LZ065]MDR5781893.1 hypothetical protein [Caballeronia sp. LZ065]
MDKLKLRFDTLNAQMKEFHELKFASDADELEKNKEIKSNIAQLLIDAKSHGDYKIFEDGVNLLFDNTVREQDFDILGDLLRQLLDMGVIDRQLLGDQLRQAQLSRLN